jgi:hypothetical protein
MVADLALKVHFWEWTLGFVGSIASGGQSEFQKAAFKGTHNNVKAAMFFLTTSRKYLVHIHYILMAPRPT